MYLHAAIDERWADDMIRHQYGRISPDYEPCRKYILSGNDEIDSPWYGYEHHSKTRNQGRHRSESSPQSRARYAEGEKAQPYGKAVNDAYGHSSLEHRLRSFRYRAHY